MAQTTSWAALFIAVCALAQTVVAQNYRMTYIVGDKIGWTYMNETSGIPADYEAWAAQHEFFVNDVLKFVYEPTGSDIYAFRNLAALTSCNISDARLLDNGTSGTSEWFLQSPGFYNFGSSKHCEDGQKFRIFVNISTVPFVPGPEMAMPPEHDHEHMSPEPAPEPSTTSSPPAKAPAPSTSAPRAWSSIVMLIVAGITGSVALII